MIRFTPLDIEQMMSTALDQEIRLGSVTTQPSNHGLVARFPLLNSPPNAPSSIIVKQVSSTFESPYDPDANEGPAWELFNEWAGYQFLNAMTVDQPDSSPLAPRFYGGDRGRGFIVIEALTPRSQLDHILLGDDFEQAQTALTALAATLGRLHTTTVGKQAEFDRLRDALGPRDKSSPFYQYDWLIPEFRKLSKAVGVVPEPGVDDELEMVASTFNQPGPFLTYTHADSCPDNCLLAGNGEKSEIRLIDFGYSEFRHALFDGVYGRMHFPLCWCVSRIPAQIVTQMESIYRAELVKGCPEAADDERYNRALVEACVVLMMMQRRLTPIAHR